LFGDSLAPLVAPARRPLINCRVRHNTTMPAPMPAWKRGSPAAYISASKPPKQRSCAGREKWGDLE
jgi:hypothetical protein